MWAGRGRSSQVNNKNLNSFQNEPPKEMNGTQLSGFNTFAQNILLCNLTKIVGRTRAVKILRFSSLELNWLEEGNNFITSTDAQKSKFLDSNCGPLSTQCDQRLKEKQPKFFEVGPKSSHCSFYLKVMSLKELQKSPDIWATFERKSVTKNFQKSPNLVALASVQSGSTGLCPIPVGLKRSRLLDFRFSSIQIFPAEEQRKGALVQWLWDETRVLKVVTLNPRTVYWKDVFTYIWCKKLRNVFL